MNVEVDDVDEAVTKKSASGLLRAEDPLRQQAWRGEDYLSQPAFRGEDYWPVALRLVPAPAPGR
jgi:hypothetical protein